MATASPDVLTADDRLRYARVLVEIGEPYDAEAQLAAVLEQRPEDLGALDLLAKIKEMPKADRDMATRLHAIVTKTAPDLMPKTWYGMPAYAADGKVVCYFTPASKFDSRYSTFGFNDDAKLDDGNMWPTSFALKKLTAADEKKIAALVKKAVG